MPQVDGKTIRERAARLRAVGDLRVQRHLAEQVGQTHSILMERPHMGRTEQFTEVRLAEARPVGQIATATISGVTATTLLA